MSARATGTARWLFSAALLALCFWTPDGRISRTGKLAAATPDSESAAPAGNDPVRARSELLANLGVTAWHRRGVRGRGVKVAVLDSGFRGYQAYLGRVLPSFVKARSFRTDGDLESRDSQHGILCAEVIHALAPDAELLLANWEPDRPDQFLEAVRWAREQGARILTCSVIMPAWSDGEGHGDIHRRLSELLGTGDNQSDLLCFASAGNTAQRHWSGVFDGDARDWQTWAPGSTDNSIRPWGSERVSVELCVAGDSALQISVEDETLARTVARGETQASRKTITVRFLPQVGHDYRLRLRRLAGQPGFFHLVVLGGGLQYAKQSGSIPFPGDGPEVIAVGAVDPQGHRLAYSSCGPNSERPKPDFVAPVPFPSLWRTRPFSGTSAAAPQAAALAALLIARHHEWNALQVRQALMASAEDLGPPGHDCETGFGRVHLP